MLFRRLVTFILITFGTTTLFAQEVNGVGDFKIGMSLEDFLELPLIKDKNVQDKASRKYSTNESDAWKTTAESQVNEYERVYSGEVVKFDFITPLGIPNIIGEDSHKVTTTFYKGKLAKVYIPQVGSEFETVLPAKYGRPIRVDKTKSVTCQNGYGAKSSHLDGAESTIWGNGKKVTATLKFSFYGCGNGGRSYLVEDGAIAKVIDRIEASGRKASEAEEAKLKASASKL